MENRESLWEQFYKTGAVSDYLSYLAAPEPQQATMHDASSGDAGAGGACGGSHGIPPAR